VPCAGPAAPRSRVRATAFRTQAPARGAAA
jgi:hypothetical protein